jgi:hypothetical protein
LLTPVQTTPHLPVQWGAHRLSGQKSLTIRAGKKLKSEELLVPSRGDSGTEDLEPADPAITGHISSNTNGPIG